MRRTLLRSIAPWTALFLFSSAAHAGAILTFDLSLTGQSAHEATFDVSLDYVPAATTDTVYALQISVVGSSDGLTAAGTDYSRFSFALDVASLPGFSELVGVDQSGAGLYADLFGAGLSLSPASQVHVGRLSVNLDGLGAGTYVVNLAGPAGLGSDASGTVNGQDVDSFAAADPSVASVRFAQAGGVRIRVANAVPEPPSLVPLALATIAVSSLLVARCRRR